MVRFIARRIARDAHRGPPDRRRGAAALRALASVPDRLAVETDAAPTAHCDDPHPGVGAPRGTDEVSHGRPSVQLRRASRQLGEPRFQAGRLGRRCRVCWTPEGAAGPASQPVPHRRRVRQSTLQLAAAARSRRAHRRLRWLPVVPAAGGVRGDRRRAGADGYAPVRCERPLRATKVRWVARTLDVPLSAGVRSLC